MTTSSDYAQLAQELSIIYTGRPAEVGALQTVENELAALQAPTNSLRSLLSAAASNSELSALINSIGNGAEANALLGTYSQPDQAETYINAIYHSLFGRAADASGLAFWSDLLTSGKISAGAMALEIATGAQNSDSSIVANKIAIAEAFEDSLASAGLTGQYTGAAAAELARALLSGVTSTTTLASYLDTIKSLVEHLVPSQPSGPTQPSQPSTPATATYTLTTGVDHLTGRATSNTFKAVLDNVDGINGGGAPATLNATDVITGVNTSKLLINDLGLNGTMSIPAGATITGITDLDITTQEGLRDNYSGWSTLKTVTIRNANGDIDLSTSDTAAIVVRDNAGKVTTTGGKTVDIVTDDNSDITVNGGSATTTVTLSGGSNNLIHDINAGSGNANTITTVSVSGDGGPATGTTKIESDAVNAVSMTSYNASVVVNAAAATRAMTLTLDGGSPASQFEDNTATTLTVKSVNHAAAASLIADAATTVNFALSADLYASLDATSASAINITGTGNLVSTVQQAVNTATVDASGSSGAILLDMWASQSFTGGSGQDFLAVYGDTPTGVITGGSANNNEILFSGQASLSEAMLANVTHFSTLAIRGINTGTTSVNFDMTGLDFTAYQLAQVGGDVIFRGVQNGSSLAFTDSMSHQVTLQLGDTHGATDGVTVELDSGAQGTHATALTLQDSSVTPQGIGTVQLVSNATDSTITNKLDNLTINGTASLDISGNANAEIGTLNDNDTGALSITNNSTDGQLTIEHIGADSTSLDTLTLTNHSSSVLAVANEFAGDALSTLNLNGDVALSLSNSTMSGITISGATDNANVSLGLHSDVNSVIDTITLGNGDNTINLYGYEGSGPFIPQVTFNISLGDGDNTLAALGSQSGYPVFGNINLTAGDGDNKLDFTFNVISENIQLGNGNNTVALGGSGTVAMGTGSNQVMCINGGPAFVTFGAHAPGADSVELSDDNTFSQRPIATDTTIDASGLSVLKGMSTGDVLTMFTSDTNLVAEVASNLVSQTGKVEFAYGSYQVGGFQGNGNYSIPSFSYDANGTDTLISFEGYQGQVSVVLIGHYAPGQINLLNISGQPIAT